MPQYHADSQPDTERQFHTEGDQLDRAGFKEPYFSDTPDGFTTDRPDDEQSKQTQRTLGRVGFSSDSLSDFPAWFGNKEI